MSLTSPEDRPTVEAAVAEFLKVCLRHGIEEEQVLQTSIAVAAGMIQKEAGKDRKYALELYDRYRESLRTAILSRY